MSSLRKNSEQENNNDQGRKQAEAIAELSAKFLRGVQSVIDKSGADTAALTQKIDEIESVASQIQDSEPPKKLDWIVAVGFIIFMITIIGTVFGQNIRWLAVSFLVMPIVIMIGLINNLKNMQPDWTETGEDVEIHVPNAPQSLQQAHGKSSHPPQTKRQYRFTIIMIGLAASFFFLVGLFLLFSEFAVDNF